jgi:ribosome-binding protein aMBF1 (putative translation factor)
MTQAKHLKESRVTSKSKSPISPVGNAHREASRRRARNPEYLAEARRIAPYEAIARIVVRRRSELKLTQAQLAERVGTSHSAISRIESGQHATSLRTLERLAAALGTHLVVGFADQAGDDGADATVRDAKGADLVALT